MSKLTERIHERRFGEKGLKSTARGLGVKGFAASIFLGIATWFVVSAVYSENGLISIVLSAVFAMLFLSVAVLIVLEKELATKIGILSIGLFCLLLFYNALVSGSFRVGFLWLFALLLAAKKLIDYDAYLASKERRLK